MRLAPAGRRRGKGRRRRPGARTALGIGLAGGVLSSAVERGVAQAWDLRLGTMLYVNRLGALRVVGFADAPDDVGYPLGVPRFYVSRAALDSRFGRRLDPRVDVAEIWLRDPRYLDQVLV